MNSGQAERNESDLHGTIFANMVPHLLIIDKRLSVNDIRNGLWRMYNILSRLD